MIRGTWCVSSVLDLWSNPGMNLLGLLPSFVTLGRSLTLSQTDLQVENKTGYCEDPERMGVQKSTEIIKESRLWEREDMRI